jgi:hypothetical protein
MILSHALRAVSKTSSLSTSFVDANALNNQTSDLSRTLTLSTHSVGDMLIVMTGNRTATPPTLLSGYTNIVSDGNTVSGASRSYRVQYKIATTTSETISWTGAYGFIVAVRNATSIGVTNTNIAGSGSTLDIADLSGLNTSGSASLLAGTYVSSGMTTTSPPYQLYAPSSTSNRFAAIIQNNTNSSVINETITSSISLLNMTWAIELLT